MLNGFVTKVHRIFSFRFGLRGGQTFFVFRSKKKNSYFTIRLGKTALLTLKSKRKRCIKRVLFIIIYFIWKCKRILYIKCGDHLTWQSTATMNNRMVKHSTYFDKNRRRRLLCMAATNISQH